MISFIKPMSLHSRIGIDTGDVIVSFGVQIYERDSRELEIVSGPGLGLIHI